METIHLKTIDPVSQALLQSAAADASGEEAFLLLDLDH